MGTDAHPVIEVKGRNGRWGLRDSKDGRRSSRRRREDRGEDVPYDEWLAEWPDYLNELSERNYALFGVLAGVRWRSVDALFANRGFPEDAAKATLKALDAESHEYHSHTHFTVQELLDADWDTVCFHEKMALFANQYLEWKDTGKLPSRLEEEQYVTGRAMWHKDLVAVHREVTEDEMLLLLLSNTTKKLVRRRKCRLGGGYQQLGPYVALTLPRTYRDVVQNFVDVIPSLVALGPPDQVRIVIAFDN